MKIGEDHISSIIYHNYFDYPLTEKELEKWRAEVKGQIVLIAGGFAIGLNLVMDYIKKKLNLV